MTTVADLKAKRDKKAVPHLEQYAPVWILDEQVFAEDEAIQFNVLFQHNTHGWLIVVIVTMDSTTPFITKVNIVAEDDASGTYGK